MVKTVYFDVAKPASPEMFQTPRDDVYRTQQPVVRDVAGARAALEQAGYTLGGDGIYVERTGRRLAMTVKVVAGYTDYIQALQLFQGQLRDAGIALDVQQVSSAQFGSDRATGDFQLLIDGLGGLPDPYSLYKQLLWSGNSAPVGRRVASNYSRFSDPAVDAALASIEGTEDEQARTRFTHQISRVVLDELPLIPLYQNSPNTTFLATKVTGWPTDDNRYAVPRADLYPDTGIIGKIVVPVR